MAGRPIERTAYLNCRQLDVCLVGVCRQQVDQLMQLVYVYAGKYTHYILCMYMHTYYTRLLGTIPTHRRAQNLVAPLAAGGFRVLT